jgi:hypothetical protein
MDPLWRPSSPLPSSLPSPAAYLLGWVDTSVPGHRKISAGATTYTIPPGYYRGDKLADELTAQGLLTSYSAGIFEVKPSPDETLVATDRLGVIMGIHARGGATLPKRDTHISQRYSPVAIPLQGGHWSRVEVDADDVLTVSRTQRAAGYVWGFARVWQVELWMSRQAWEAFSFGWCSKGRVTLTPDLALADAMSGAESGGYLQGQVLSVSRGEWTSPTEVQARVTMRIAEEPS